MDSRYQPLCIMLANQFIGLVNLHLRHNLDTYLKNPELQSQLQELCHELYACFNLQSQYNIREWLSVQNLLSKELIALPNIETELTHYKMDEPRFQQWLEWALKTQFSEKDFNYLIVSLNASYQADKLSTRA